MVNAKVKFLRGRFFRTNSSQHYCGRKQELFRKRTAVLSNTSAFFGVLVAKTGRKKHYTVNLGYKGHIYEIVGHEGLFLVPVKINAKIFGYEGQMYKGHSGMRNTSWSQK